MSAHIDTVIFDLGGVLIDWNPEYLYLKVFEGDHERTRWFLDHVCTGEWNENQDAGYPLAKATSDKIAEYPEFESLIKLYYGRWEEMLGGSLEETVKILRSLTTNKDLKLIALTNWSAETFPVALDRFDFLQWFDGIVVSGEEGTRKPFDKIYEITLERFDIRPERAVFIDDNLRNVKAFEKMGVKGIHFKTPSLLKQKLKEFAIKI